VWEQTNSIPKNNTLEYTITKNREYIMSEVQLMIIAFLCVLSVWFLIIIISAIQQEKRFERMQENLEKFREAQEQERLTNKKIK
jgi:hypothetical protein